jgi:hypothetical protein
MDREALLTLITTAAHYEEAENEMPGQVVTGYS